MSNQDKRNASQRIEDLERAMMSLYQTADNMARDLMTIKDAIKILGNKVDAIVKASSRGETLSDEVVAAIMVENNVEELKNKLNMLVAQGILVPEAVVSATSFVVGREVDDSGKVVNPRLQFTMSGLQEQVREKIVGAVPGQTLTLEEGKLKFEVLESYAIQTPQPPSEESSDESSSESSESASEAPAEEQASS